MILAERAARASDAALIAHLELEIEKLRRTLYGPSSERKARLLDQLELQLEELAAAATEDELAAEEAAQKTQTVRSFQRKRPLRKPFPDDIERERVVIEAPTSCRCCGGSRLAKLGEDVTETLEVVPRRWKVIETVREKFTCRDCEAITQPPAPFHATPRGFIGPKLLATILFDKFGQHIPLNRQSQRFKCEGIDLSVSTLADQVGAGSFAAMPLCRLNLRCAWGSRSRRVSRSGCFTASIASGIDPRRFLPGDREAFSAYMARAWSAVATRWLSWPPTTRAEISAALLGHGIPDHRRSQSLSSLLRKVLQRRRSVLRRSGMRERPPEYEVGRTTPLG